MKIIVGLGNPGAKYAGTRHNVGFSVILKLADKYNISLTEKKHKAEFGKGIIEGEKVILAMPQTYMNLSGESVRELMDYYKCDCSDIIVIYDDIDLAVGRLRIREKGSAGGHNGIKNIIAHLGTDVFPRVKVGVGAPSHPDYDMVDWVIGSFSAQEKKIVDEALDRALDAAECIISRGVTEAQNRFN